MLLSRCNDRRFFRLEHHTKADVIDFLPLWIAQAKSRTAAFGPVVERATADDLTALGRWCISTIVITIRVRFVGRKRPLSNVAVHVIEAPGVRPIAADVRRGNGPIVAAFFTQDVSAVDGRQKDAFAVVAGRVTADL